MTLADWQPGSAHGVLLSADARLGRARSTIWPTPCTKSARDEEKTGPPRSTTPRDTVDRDEKRKKKEGNERQLSAKSLVCV